MVADLQRKTLAEKKTTEELMTLQRETFNGNFTEIKIECDRIRESIKKLVKDVDKKLEVLKGFNQSIKSNLAKIDQNTVLCKKAMSLVEEFRTDDMFINC